jgi:hypothetical protein
MATEANTIDRPSHDGFSAAATPSTGSTSIPTTATPKDSDANEAANRNEQRQNQRRSDNNKTNRGGKGDKRKREFGTKHKK